MKRAHSLACLLMLGFAQCSAAAPPDRIVRPVDANRVRALSGNIHSFAQSRFDRGAADLGMRLDYMMLMVKPSATQQAELDRALEALQSPAEAVGAA